ncbi:MAG TPA: DUF480 domain-containing protein [Isosphaeraceae bacterium]|nr:DUF480 domain-containing protein [Isosphaeraceae bacterium]
MSGEMSEKTWVPLTPGERRVLGVLVEKAKTTPEYYPLTVNALVNGCNQKSNRDPLTNYDADDVELILESLRKKGAVVRLEGTGRVLRWKHTLYDWLSLRDQPVAMAVMAELLLRGPQTEGDLRARASRMEPIPDLPALEAVLDTLRGRGLVVQLSPPGQRRGVVVTHGLYPPADLEALRQRQALMPVEEPAARTEAASSGSGGLASEVIAMRAELEALRATVQALESEVRAIKTALGS